MEEFFAGCTGGVCGIIAGYPLDTIKVRQQVHNTLILKTIKETWYFEGIRGFYKGVSLPILTAGMYNSTFFGIYSNIFKWLQDNDLPDNSPIQFKNPNWVKNMIIASGVGGFITAIVSNPIEIIKTQLQTAMRYDSSHLNRYHRKMIKKPPILSIFQTVITVYENKGWKGFYAGFISFIIRDVFTFPIYMYTFIICNKWMKEKKWSDLISQPISGGLAGSISFLPVIPFDTMKSRIQSQDPRYPKYKDMVDCFVKTYKEGRLKIFYRGTTVLLMRAFALNAVTFVVYYQTLKLIKGKEAYDT